MGGKISWESYDKSTDPILKLKGILREIRKETHVKFENFVLRKDNDCLTEKVNTYKGDIKIGIEIIDKSIQKLYLKSVDILKKILNQLEIEFKFEFKYGKKNELEKYINGGSPNDVNKEIKELTTKVRELEVEFNKQKDLSFKKTKEFESNISKIKEFETEVSRKNKLKTKLFEEQEYVNKLYDKVDREVNNLSDAAKLAYISKKLKPEEKLIVKKLFGKFPTIVLDELNSMNVESQGVLLRFLEQAEITPIGGYEDKMEEKIGENSNGDEVEKAYREFITDFLIVGLMNEDPEVITREEAIKFLKKERYIGGLLGDLLYEHIMKTRRLRPDLRARMMRNGKFKMPKLADHRTDIPHTFYRIINDSKKDYFPNSEIRITIDALEYLMSEKWEWHENFRLLETLVNKVIEVMYEDYENGRDIPKIYDNKNLVIIRQNHVYKAMKEIGIEDEFKKEK